MKKFGKAAVGTAVAAGLAAAAIGLATPSQAAPQIPVPVASYVTDVDHHGWIIDIQPNVNVPQVDTGIRHSGR